MTQQVENGFKTFLSAEALAPWRRVKLSAENTVVYADAGEQAIGTTVQNVLDATPVTVRLTNATGTVKVNANDAFSALATLYAHGSGRVSDSSDGSAIGVALEAATAQDDIIEMIPFNVLSTTAGTVSIADGGSFTSESTVEGVVQEILQHIQSAQSHIGVALTDCREVSSNNIPDITDTPAGNDAYGGLLHAGSSPTLLFANGDTDSGLLITWANTDVTSIVFQRALPPRFDPSADLVLHIRTKSSASSDTSAYTIDSYFNEGDTKVEDTSAAITNAFTEVVATIANADIPAGAQTVTIEITPGSHGTDDTIISALSLEWTGTTLQS